MQFLEFLAVLWELPTSPIQKSFETNEYVDISGITA
jgi:hypothetical protein